MFHGTYDASGEAAASSGGQALVNAIPFQLDLELVPNSNLALQAAFPLVVHRFRYETHPR